MFSGELIVEGEGVVAFLDALGTKGVWARAEPREMIRSWGRIIENMDNIVRDIQIKTKPNLSDWDMKAFSDTVIVSVKFDEDPVGVIPLMGEVIMVGFLEALNAGIYFRGVISVGKFFRSNRSIIGPAIDEAAEWYREPEWIGVSVSPTAYFGIEKLREQRVEISRQFVEYNIPMKQGIEEKGWALAWPNRLPFVTGNPPVTLDRAKILDEFTQKPIGTSAASKYRNTLAFIDHVKGSTPTKSYGKKRNGKMKSN